MLKKIALSTAAAALMLGLGATGALADDCHSDHATGTVLGAIAGGLIGSAASHGNGGAVVGGAIVGGLAGNAISRDIDCDDRDYASRAYEDAFDGDVGRHYEWEGRHGGHGYIVVNRAYREDGHRCVDFTQVVWHHDDRREHDGTACHRHGNWEIMDS